MKKAIILLSGGLDSATTLYFAKHKGFDCSCLIFDYAQRHKREIKSAKKIAQKTGCPYTVIRIDLPWKGSALLDKNVAVPNKRTSKIPSTYVPARNIIFLSFAFSFAESKGASVIFIGAHAQDYSGYPDCRPEFFKAFEKVIRVGTKAGVEGKSIKIETPLINKNKAEIIKLGAKLRVPFELTWSCYRGGSVPCGECDSCFYRAKGFKTANIRDTLFAKAKPLFLPKPRVSP